MYKQHMEMAAEYWRQMAGARGLTVRGSTVVHAIGENRWFFGLLMPYPQCGTGVSGWDPGAVHPEWWRRVSCRKCLRPASSEDHPPGFGQLMLFAEVSREL